MENNVLEIVIKAKDLASKTIQDVGKVAEKEGARFTQISKQLGAVGVAMTGIGIVGIKVMESWVRDASEAQKVTAQLESVLKSTGGVAGMTKDSLLGLADSLSKVTAYDD